MIKGLWDVTLTVSDLDRAVQFYEGVLGLEKKHQFKDYAGLDCGGVEIGLKTWGELERPRRGEPYLDLMVGDIDAVYGALQEKGVRFEAAPRETPWGARMTDFFDPDGNHLRLVQIDWPTYFGG